MAKWCPLMRSEGRPNRPANNAATSAENGIACHMFMPEIARQDRGGIGAKTHEAGVAERHDAGLTERHGHSVEDDRRKACGDREGQQPDSPDCIQGSATPRRHHGGHDERVPRRDAVPPWPDWPAAALRRSRGQQPTGGSLFNCRPHCATEQTLRPEDQDHDHQPVGVGRWSIPACRRRRSFH